MLSYRIATADDYDALTELLNKYFYPDEPFNSGWVNDDKIPEDMAYCLESIGSGMSFVAVNEETKAIVGACLTGVDEASSIQTMLDEANRTTSKKWSQYLRLYARIDVDANIFERFNVEQSFHVHTLVVHGDYRGKSVAQQLLEKSYALAAARGFKLCSINCSSVFTEQIALKLRMERVGEIAMSDIKDEQGERLIYPPPPHTHITTYAKRL